MASSRPSSEAGELNDYAGLTPSTVGYSNPQYKMPPGGIAPATFPANYLSEYIDHCWRAYTDVKVTLQSPRGSANLYTGSVDRSGNFVFVKNDAPNDQAYRHTIAKPPSSADVFGCNGVFDRVGGPSPNYAEIDGDIKNQIASALNRTVLHNPSYDAWCQASSFYTPWSGGTSPVTNLYAKTLHAQSIGGLAYAFAYDDQCGRSTTVHGSGADMASAELTVTLTAF